MNAARVDQRRALWMTLACLLAGVGVAAAQGTPPSYSGFSANVCIPFVSDPNNQNLSFTDAPHLAIALGGGTPLKMGKPRNVVMDTGSVGIAAVPYSQIPNYQTLKATGQCGYEFLSSSKLLWVGHWVQATVAFYAPPSNGQTATRTCPVLGGKGNPPPTYPCLPVATANVKVLGVEQVWLCRNFKHGDVNKETCKVTNCETQQQLPTPGIVYMGVGFGREQDNQPQGTPDKNALLNLATMQGKQVATGTFNPGYIIGSAGITVGLTPTNTAGFNFIKLLQAPAPPSPPSVCATVKSPDWTAPCMSVQASGSSCPSGGCQGTLLVDTGIDYSFVTAPWNLSPVSQQNPCNTSEVVKMLPPGNSVVVNLTTQTQTGQTGQVGTVNLVGAQTTSVTPCYVVPDLTNPPNGQPKPVFVNTGRHFLRQYQFLYDAKNGYVGLQSQANNCGGPPAP